MGATLSAHRLRYPYNRGRYECVDNNSESTDKGSREQLMEHNYAPVLRQWLNHRLTTIQKRRSTLLRRDRG
jgi:hypothetical protein